MTSIFIQPARRLALRSGTRAFSMTRTSLLKPSASLRGYLTEDYNAKPKSDLDISKEILQKQLDYGILQLEAKEVRRSINKARRDRFRVRRKRITRWLFYHPGTVLITFWVSVLGSLVVYITR